MVHSFAMRFAGDEALDDRAREGQAAPAAPIFPDPIRVDRPDPQRLPVVLSSPHSGRVYPQAFLAASRLDPVAIRRSEDSFVDELAAGAHAQGVPLLGANFPRAYLDVNREPYELDPAMFHDPLPAHANTRSLRVGSGLGTIARVVREGAEIYREKLSFAEAERRIRSLYHPYHEALSALMEETRARFGAAILIDCHSMPSTAGVGDRDAGRARADIVLGDRFGASCAPAVMRKAEEVLRGHGLSVERNRPYAGGFSTEHYGRPYQGLHALQIEINRALYMDEDRIERRPAGMARIESALAATVAALGAIEPRDLKARTAR